MRTRRYTCPKCKAVILIEPKQTGFFCDCGLSGTLSGLVDIPEVRTPPKTRIAMPLQMSQRKLPIQGGVPTNRIFIPEETNQKQTITRLCELGYEVLQTTVRFRLQLCEHCGQVHKPNALPTKNNPDGSNGYGASPGVPDVMVSHKRWVIPIWLALEMKSSSVTWSKLSEKQKELYIDGRIAIVDCLERALHYVESADKLLRRIKPEYATPFRFWEEG